jgi:hypothetical protein
LQELPKRTLVPGAFRSLDGHAVVLYGSDEQPLVKHVAAWLGEHLAREYPVLVVGTPAHRRAVGATLRRAGIDTGEVRRAGLYTCLDATAVMNTMAGDGEISWRTFDRNVGELVRNLRMRGPLRVYGEIVNLMWLSGNRKGAIELEMLWNRLRARVDFELLCGYGIDAHGSDFAIGAAEGIIRTHTSVVPYGSGDSSH